MKQMLLQKIHNMSLLTRMLVISTFMLTVVVSSILLFVMRDEIDEAKNNSIQTVDMIVATIPPSIIKEVSTNDFEAVAYILNGYAKHPGIESLKYTDSKGAVIEIKNSGIAYKANYPEFFATLFSIKNFSTKTILSKSGQSYGNIEITTSVVNSTNEIWYRFLKWLLLFSFIAILNIITIWLIMKRRLIPSLKALEESAIKLSTMHSEIYIKEGGAPELRNTLAAFNKMANTIKQDRDTIKKALDIQNAFFESNAAGFLLVSSDRTMLMANKQFYELFGYTQNEVIGKNVRLIHVSDETYNEWAPRFQTAKDGTIIANVEYTLKHKDGHVMWCSLYGSKIELDNGEKGVIWSMIDLTERKNAEENLKSLNIELENKIQQETSARLEQERILMQQSRMAAMGEMIGAIAHQWRQPLNALGIMIQDLKYIQRDGELTPEALERTIKKSMDIIKFMSKTIDDFRGFFKVEKKSAVVVVSDRIKYSTELLLAQLSAHGIELNISGDKELELQCLANEFDQVILNLVNNAKDILIANVIKEPNINIDISKENEMVKIIISDNGGGIPPAIIDKIFDPYFTTKGPDKGTGMGLYMSKIIIETHMNGRLSVQNGADGAIFTIELPI